MIGFEQATHTSEDNAAFGVLQEKAKEDHKRKYHWAYDELEDNGSAKLHLLSDGTWMDKERRLLMDKACEAKNSILYICTLRDFLDACKANAKISLGLDDKRPVAPDTWKFRARNPLLFPPELETTRDIG